ncbi:MAG: hypothetical protein GWO44_16790, partial [Thermoplasmata archaeon]|nr:hypothetical protein [Thermoplasmata archaeon]NIY04859.1 hypothetical protein [Thermoplasmata archaeon]
HFYKTSHLWLEDDGGCLVSIHALEWLKGAGMPNLEVVGVTYDPPPTGVGR